MENSTDFKDLSVYSTDSDCILEFLCRTLIKKSIVCVETRKNCKLLVQKLEKHFKVELNFQENWDILVLTREIQTVVMVNNILSLEELGFLRDISQNMIFITRNLENSRYMYKISQLQNRQKSKNFRRESEMIGQESRVEITRQSMKKLNLSCFEFKRDHTVFPYLFIQKDFKRGFVVLLTHNLKNNSRVYFLEKDLKKLSWSFKIQAPFSLKKGKDSMQLSAKEIEFITKFQISICQDLLNQKFKLDLESSIKTYLFCPVTVKLSQTSSCLDWDIDFNLMQRILDPPVSLMEICRKDLNDPKFLTNLIVKTRHNQMLYRCLGIEKIVDVDSFSEDLGMTFKEFYRSQGYEDEFSSDILIQARLISTKDFYRNADDKNLASNSLLLERSCLCLPYGWDWYCMFTSFRLEMLIFEHHAALSEFERELALDLEFLHLEQAFLAPSAQDVLSYERLEFVGDSILKYLVTVDLCENYPKDSNNSISVARSVIVSNKNLYLSSQCLNLEKLLISFQLREKYWIPPFFVSSDVTLIPSHSVTSKMVADSFEALLGVIYIHHGIEKCRDFLWKIGLLRRFENDVNFCDYRDLVSTDIEKSLKYTFSNKSLLIAALGKDMTSQEDYCLFRRLECLGDAALELISTIFLFKSDTSCSVGVLNDQRQNLICNRNFSILSCKYGLTDSLSKFGSDVWESVCGAILIDLSFNIEDFKEIILPHIVLSFTQDPKSCVQQLNEISQTDLFKDSDFDYRFSQNTETNYFTCHVWIDNLCIASGIGKCKSEAKRHACESALSCFSIGSSL